MKQFVTVFLANGETFYFEEVVDVNVSEQGILSVVYTNTDKTKRFVSMFNKDEWKRTIFIQD